MSVPAPRVQRARGPGSWLARACAVAVVVFSAVAQAQVGTVNLALNRPVVTSSAEGPFTGNFAVDGDAGTRWGSAFTATEWLQVDLGQSTPIARVVLTWEPAYGRGYTVQVSNDAATWQDARVVTDGDGGVDDLTGLSGVGRYVRMRGVQRATGYGYSLWELEVYGVGTEQLSITGLNTGSHTWRVRAVDGAGNSTLSSGPITFTK